MTDTPKTYRQRIETHFESMDLEPPHVAQLRAARQEIQRLRAAMKECPECGSLYDARSPRCPCNQIAEYIRDVEKLEAKLRDADMVYRVERAMHVSSLERVETLQAQLTEARLQAIAVAKLEGRAA